MEPVARLDHARPARTGEPEVVYAEPKTPEQVGVLVAELLAAGTAPVLATRCSPAHAAAVPGADYDPVARLLVARACEPQPALGRVVVASGGTGDLPVASEAIGVLRAFGITCRFLADLGVSDITRVLSERDELGEADVVVVVAGMEATLPTVVAGLVTAPVVAVPTSVGYGAAFEGLAALLSSLTSCAPGVAVVNIDNGFGAAMLARRILRVGAA
ncbi:MAG TPA: nickel pincer cofactor biosynthesis protein LarB [Egibacteraceae bacterium]|nr:nickel pincer cofactor biosynthesis protein LarB [Egibacteraceae bacterium]